jgi:polyhydroxyalkanoate synthesis regulator phasin
MLAKITSLLSRQAQAITLLILAITTSVASAQTSGRRIGIINPYTGEVHYRYYDGIGKLVGESRANATDARSFLKEKENQAKATRTELQQRYDEIMQRQSALASSLSDLNQRRADWDKGNDVIDTFRRRLSELTQELNRLRNQDPPSITSPSWGTRIRRIADLESNTRSLKDGISRAQDLNNRLGKSLLSDIREHGRQKQVLEAAIQNYNQSVVQFNADQTDLRKALEVELKRRNEPGDHGN